MTYWFTADTHFNHENIISYCNRPFKSVAHMDMEIIRRWNERVNTEDTVFHLGDFCFSRRISEDTKKDADHYKDQLNGNIIVIKGNHDSRNDVKSVITSMTINHGGVDIHMSHEPCTIYKFNFNGHIHDLWDVRCIGPYIQVNVGVDVWDFRPIDIQEIWKRLVEHGIMV